MVLPVINASVEKVNNLDQVKKMPGVTHVAVMDATSRGQVVAVLSNPANDLLELDDGTLVPEVFVTDASGLPGHLVVDPPEGLLGVDEA